MNKNTNLAINLAIGVIGMIMLAYAAVPIYRLFCQQTGFGGTVQIMPEVSRKVGTKKFKVFFDANTESSLPWKFKNTTVSLEGVSGANLIAYYYAENLANSNTKAMATYNVTPLKVGKYFKKVECFCFEEQILNPKQKTEFPVLFYIDPKIENDPNMDDVTEITLSYTFFNLDQ